MMIASKFGIGQQVRHKLLGYLGVVVDVDAEYSLDQPNEDDIASNMTLRSAPWYHVVMEDDEGQPVHTYLAEAQITYELSDEHLDNDSMDELSQSIRNQLQAPRLRNRPLISSMSFCHCQKPPVGTLCFQCIA